jgi:LysM repeat protein
MVETGVRAKMLVFISLVLNAALGVAWWQLYRSAQSVPGVSAEGPLMISNTGFRVTKTNLVLRARDFTWRDLESTNYEFYVLNLRGIGCPEPTVRDIIVADVNQMYARKRQELSVSTNDFKWWRSEPDPEEARALTARLEALEVERRRLLTRLLGPSWQQRSESESEPLPLTGAVLANLSAEQKQAVQEIVERSHKAVRDYTAKCEEAGESVDPAILAQLRERTRRELEAKLNPEELMEFLLRYANTAAQLRDQLRGLNATPEEFRKLFAATDAIDRQLQLLPADDDPATAERRRVLQAQREAAMRQNLSPARYEAYRMLTDSDFRLAMVDAQQNGAPAQAGRALYEMNQAAAQERERINADGTLTPEEKEKQLKNIEQQLKGARSSLLGLEPPPETKTPPEPQVFQHSVGPHETLEAISLYYRVPLSELLQANPGLNAGLVRPGQTVKVPQPQGIPFRSALPPGR